MRRGEEVNTYNICTRNSQCKIHCRTRGNKCDILRFLIQKQDLDLSLDSKH
jgi:hypothetical protein